MAMSIAAAASSRMQKVKMSGQVRFSAYRRWEHEEVQLFGPMVMQLGHLVFQLMLVRVLAGNTDPPVKDERFTKLPQNHPATAESRQG